MGSLGFWLESFILKIFWLYQSKNYLNTKCLCCFLWLFLQMDFSCFFTPTCPTAAPVGLSIRARQHFPPSLYLWTKLVSLFLLPFPPSFGILMHSPYTYEEVNIRQLWICLQQTSLSNEYIIISLWTVPLAEVFDTKGLLFTLFPLSVCVSHTHTHKHTIHNHSLKTFLKTLVLSKSSSLNSWCLGKSSGSLEISAEKLQTHSEALTHAHPQTQTVT